MKRFAFALLAAFAGCAATAPEPAPTYTRAQIADLPTAEFARMLLPPEQAADVVQHGVRRSVYHVGRDLQAVDFYRSPYILASDICLRERITVTFTDPVRRPPREGAQDLPKRVDTVTRIPEIGLVPNCADLPGRRFAHLYGDLALVDGLQILRTLAAARTLAAGTQPLPYRLLCRPVRGEIAACTAADRAAFAALPLHAVDWVRRGTPGLGMRQLDDALGGDLLLLHLEGPGYWQVRMIDMGRPGATILLSAAGWAVQ